MLRASAGQAKVVKPIRLDHGHTAATLRYLFHAKYEHYKLHLGGLPNLTAPTVWLQVF